MNEKQLIGVLIYQSPEPTNPSKKLESTSSPTVHIGGTPVASRQPQTA